MGNLFSTTPADGQKPGQGGQKPGKRQQLDEVFKVIDQEAAGTGMSAALGAQMGAQRGVEPIVYAKEQQGRCIIEHARVGDDYVIQVFARSELRKPWQD